MTIEEKEGEDKNDSRVEEEKGEGDQEEKKKETTKYGRGVKKNSCNLQLRVVVVVDVICGEEWQFVRVVQKNRDRALGSMNSVLFL